ncbi:elongation factor Ts [Tsukamurella pulmonis]|uniref:Elongation factor Ts n=1 Tax=Tsukamurella pulmonis TaxID=47312 RepID=A0A1H1DWP2_9ACTN|nr:translation elongation factor Ts [Tsukamurella pulmonis]KXO92170.1 elongation factor Ts [Tsukamurella pulmonis]SDQ80941.1 translation elongation factor Ts (EF-Ts) [Tsukamurella pulmonis]SUP21584.1 Elongation factor Ts [Tsukamurella pulmonis]
MANYTAADVKRLRDLTGSGMMDCKNALTETDGDFDKAVEVLRIKGAKDVGKRAGRSTAEGLVAAKDGVLIELNSETDFVAKNEEFQQLADAIVAATAASDAATVEAVEALTIDGETVAARIEAASAKLGEKLVLRRVARYDGPVAVYLHKRSSDLPPAVGVLVSFEGEGDTAAEAARGAGMQIAALKAKYASRDEVPADVIENERRIAEETARAEGKPEQALPKIIEGKTIAYYKDTVLPDQPSVTDNKKSVQQVLDEAGAKVVAFTRFEVGQD